jgi:hypothetical protein
MLTSVSSSSLNGSTATSLPSPPSNRSAVDAAEDRVVTGLAEEPPAMSVNLLLRSHRPGLSSVAVTDLDDRAQAAGGEAK